MSKKRLDKIDSDMLTPFVQKALDNPSARITEWDYQIVKGDGTLSKRLVCRFFGQAATQKREVSWSIFLKVPNPTQTHLDAWHREPFQREPILYQSGILKDLPGGIFAPCCFGVVEHSDDEPWMWLEDVSGKPALEWPLERFRVAAYHFGMMQGAFMADVPLPDYPWLDTSGWLKPKLANPTRRVPNILDKFRIHPLTRELWNSQIGERLRWLWDNKETFFSALSKMPGTLCHGDFNYTNLFARRLPNGEDQTVVIDWQYSGVRQIGEDMAGFIADSSIIPVRRKAAEPKEFTEMMIEAYLAGLRDAGWKGDLRVVRFACLTTLAFPWSFNLLAGLNGNVLNHQITEDNRRDMDQKLNEYIQTQEFMFGLAEEARTLLEVIDH